MLTADDPRHGTHNGYANYGCRCDRCREAATAYSRDRGVGPYRREPCPRCGAPKLYKSAVCDACRRERDRVDEHGTNAMVRRGCKCDACLAFQAAMRRAYRDRHKVPCVDCGALVEGKGRPNTRTVRDGSGARVALDPDRPPRCRPCAMRARTKQTA